MGLSELVRVCHLVKADFAHLDFKVPCPQIVLRQRRFPKQQAEKRAASAQV